MFLQLKKLMLEANPGEDFRMDRALQQACQPVVDVACKDIKPGSARYCIYCEIGCNILWSSIQYSFPLATLVLLCGPNYQTLKWYH